MKFRSKMTICMISLVAFLFGIGGTLFLWFSFQAAKDREISSSVRSFHVILNTFSLVSQAKTWTSTQEIATDFAILTEQNDLFAAIQLRNEDAVIYRSSPNITIGQELTEVVRDDRVAYRIIEQNGEYHIQLCALLHMESAALYLDALYDITGIFEQEAELEKIYYLIFLIMVIGSAVLSYGVSFFLTRPISILTETATNISQGDYELRSNVKTKDEIGDLAAEFNVMADALVAKMDELNEAMEQQRQFIGNFTHELKTPMTSMIGYADLLQRQTLSAEEQMDAANYIFSESKRLERLSIKLLELIASDQQKQELSMQNPAYLLEQTTSRYAEIFAAQGIGLELVCEQGYCRLEPDFFVSLVVNLLENARRAMEQGGRIQVALAMTETGCNLTIVDSGCGIPEENLAHITEAFYRVDKARSRAFGGAGLGLSLCDRIAKMHSGTLEISSKVGVGTTVIVHLNGGRI